MRVGRRTSALVAALLIAGTGFAFAAQALDVTISAIVAGDVTGTVQWAMPQGRVGATETNDDTDFYFTIRTSSDLDDVILQTIPASSLLTTDVDCTFATTTNLVVTPGTYDVGFKGSQHLTRVVH